ncbi:MAG TPA: polysaccharide biosynthesis/export family protein [Vicinamibacterales bacterium]|nr:polysaccharide biosynthesis/export family protein [Vicinamibacterales bacterium]
MGTHILSSLFASLALTATLAAHAQQPPQNPQQPPAGQQQPPAPAAPFKPDFVIPKPDGPTGPPQTQQPLNIPATVGDLYVIGPQDTLAVTVVDEPDLTRRYIVDSDGAIQMPYLGRVAAAGLTVEDLRHSITNALQKDWIKNPQVLVGVEQYKARSVLVTGAVRSPQRVTLTGLTMSLLEALTLAGSPTSQAANEVTVVRAKIKPGQKEPESITVDRRELELGKAGRDVVLEDGDIINVPEAQKFWVSGAVKNTGQYVYESGMTVARALIVAGGLSERGSDRRITIKREINGKVQEISVKSEDKIKPNDEIVVGQRLF